MKPAPFRYHAPDTVEDALALLGNLDNAKPLAGGQSLMAMLNLRYAMPDDLVDLNGIASLRGIVTTDNRIDIGAMTRQRELQRDPALVARAPIFAAALKHVGHIQTRNRGTIGGSLCHLDPAAELPALAMLYDATLTVRSAANGERTLEMRDFPAFYMTPDLAPDELLTGLSIRPWPAGTRQAFLEFARRHGDFAVVAVGCLVALDRTGRITRAAIVLGGLGAAPVRLGRGEEMMAGQSPAVDLIAAVAAETATLDAMEDSTYSADYRQHLAEVLVRRALTRACFGGGGGMA